MSKACSIEGCGRPRLARGWCSKHYNRWHRTGDPLDWGKRAPTPSESLQKRGVLDERTGCVNWTGGLHKDGYGAIADGNGSSLLAHRFAWEQAMGPVPEGLVVDHRCRNRACVRVDHLRTVTQAVNSQNRGATGRGRSGIRGVWWNSSRQKWVAGLKLNGRTIHLGYFDDPGEAGREAAAARRRLMPLSGEEMGE